MIGSYERSVERVMEFQRISRETAEKLIRQNDREWVGFMRHLFGIDEANPHFYDLVIRIR
jgi:cytidylate kinase